MSRRIVTKGSVMLGVGLAALWAGPVAANGYCTAAGQVTSYEWIDGVQVGSTLSTTHNDHGYAEVTSPTFQVSPGENTLTLTPGYAYGSYTERWVVLIDLDHDGTFGAGEQVYSGSGSGTLSSSFTIPASATPGLTTLRVLMRYGSYPSACGTFYYGEVEDHPVQIAGSGPLSTTATVGFAGPVVEDLVIVGRFERNGVTYNTNQFFYPGSASQRVVNLDVDAGTQVVWRAHRYLEEDDLLPVSCSVEEGSTCLLDAGSTGETVLFSPDQLAPVATTVTIGFDRPVGQDLAIVGAFLREGVLYNSTHFFTVGMAPHREVTLQVDPGTDVVWRAQVYLQPGDLDPTACSVQAGTTCVTAAGSVGEVVEFAEPGASDPPADQVLDFEDAFGGATWYPGPTVDIDGVTFTTTAPYFYNPTGSPFSSDYLSGTNLTLSFPAPVDAISFQASGNCTNCTTTVTVTADGVAIDTFQLGYGVLSDLSFTLPPGTMTVGFTQSMKLDNLAIDYP